MAEIYDKTTPGPHDHTVINAVREAYIQPFQATDWLDLRVGFFLSVCGDDTTTEDDVITGLAESITEGSSGAGLGPEDRYWIGVKNRSTGLPRTAGVVFMGYSNSTPANFPHYDTTGNSDLISSDIGWTTTNAYYWRPNNSHNLSWSAIVTDGTGYRSGNGVNGVQQHFVQNTVSAGGYATLLALRFRRNNVGGQARIITMSTKKVEGFFSTDILFTNDPSSDILEENLREFPTEVATFGPVQLSAVPDAMYFYWPFRNSRLRVHAVGVYKAA